MAIRVEQAGSVVALKTGAASAQVDVRGAELRRWLTAGRDMIWTPDPAFWADAAPILFPVVGWTRDGQTRVGGKTYPLGLHGFARHCDFVVEEQHSDRVTLRLDDTEETRAQYPFAFALRVEYALEAEALTIALHVENKGLAALPYACGLHPGLRWPFDGGAPTDYRIVFDEAENPYVPVIAPGGLFSTETRPASMRGRALPLSPEVFSREALCFLEARSRRLIFARQDGAALRVELEDFPHIALWSRPGAPFLCIEPWTGHGDPVGFAGELADKPSMRLLAPGRRARHAARFSLVDGGFDALGEAGET